MVETSPSNEDINPYYTLERGKEADQSQTPVSHQEKEPSTGTPLTRHMIC
jgi:hypothetical protein